MPKRSRTHDRYSVGATPTDSGCPRDDSGEHSVPKHSRTDDRSGVGAAVADSGRLRNDSSGQSDGDVDGDAHDLSGTEPAGCGRRRETVDSVFIDLSEDQNVSSSSRMEIAALHQTLLITCL